MAPITFGSMTMPMNNVPRAIAQGDTGIGYIQNLNSAFSSGPTGQVGTGGGPKLTADVAADYKGIRANMGQPQNRSLLGKIADFIVNKKLDNAV